MSPSDTTPREPVVIGSVGRAIAVLDVLGEHPGGLGVNEVGRRIGVNPSTASRLLGTLEGGGLVERDGRGPYRLGLRLVALADAVLARLDVRALAAPRLRILAAETGETATLSIAGPFGAITVDFVPATTSVVSMAHIGRPSVAHATAAGKVALAFGAGAVSAEDPLTRYTGRTIVDPELLAAEIARVLGRGWAEATGEREPDLNALAVPAFDRHGSLAAIVGLQGPSARLTAGRRRAVLECLSTAADGLTADLGGAAG